MKGRRWLLIGLFLVLAVLLYFNFTRQLLKMTALFALPLVLLQVLRRRLPSRHWGRWILAAAMLMIVAVYGTQLYKLPVKTQVWNLNEQGAALVAAGRYEEARQVYRQIGDLGEESTMLRKLAQVDEQESYEAKLEQARKLVQAGQKQQAITLLKAIPPTAGNYREARKLLKGIE